MNHIPPDLVARLKQLTAIEQVAIDLRRQTSCEHYHHSPDEYHSGVMPCPVEARYDRVLGITGWNGSTPIMEPR